MKIQMSKNIEYAFNKLINADMKAPYYKIINVTNQELWFVKGTSYHWDKSGTRFSLNEIDLVNDLSIQCNGKVLLVEY
jgi:hypothetical protein